MGKPFLGMPRKIRTHVFSNGMALLVGTAIQLGLHDDSGWYRLLYKALLWIGSIAAISFSWSNPGHNAIIKAGFTCMALGALLPSVVGRFDMSYASLFGAGVVFRAMAIGGARTR